MTLPSTKTLLFTGNSDKAVADLPNNWLREYAVELIQKVHLQMPELHQALRLGDLPTIAKHAHWIKGSGGTVGLPQLSEIARCCEDAVNEHEPVDVANNIRRIEAYVDCLLEKCYRAPNQQQPHQLGSAFADQVFTSTS